MTPAPHPQHLDPAPPRGGALVGLLLLGQLLAGCAPLPASHPAGLAQSPLQTALASRDAEAQRAASAERAATDTLPPTRLGADAWRANPSPGSPPPAPLPEPTAEPRFDLIVNNANARDVFLALVADSRYNMLTHPDLSGTLSVTLKRVTLREALEAIRDVYGYDFRIDGRRITVSPPALQSRVFTVNYLHSQRSGRSDMRVSSGSAPTSNSSGANGATNTNSTSTSTTGSGSGGNPQLDSSQLSTQSRNDLWGELGEALRGMVGTAGGRHVILSPQSGLIAVRAMPDELRQVEALLSATRLAIERQVMLDVKIVQVELREGFQSGIDWSVLKSKAAVGSLGGSGSNPVLSNANGLPTLPAGTLGSDAVSLPAAGGGLFGLSLATSGFQSVMGFLETHGDVQTLSSPRLATLNNQKAVLKVGTDDYFVTNVSGGTVNNGGSNSSSSTTLPTLSLTPFFSGIALDVTPQIDEGHMITLHVHPSVSAVTERSKQVDLGTLGSYKLPLASASINETDTIVRIPDGQIVAIGGLMEQESSRQTSGLPGSAGNGFSATLLGNRANSARKKELVVLIKPSIIRSADDWQQHTQAAWAALDDPSQPVRVIRVDGPAPASSAAPASAPANTAANDKHP